MKLVSPQPLAAILLLFGLSHIVSACSTSLASMQSATDLSQIERNPAIAASDKALVERKRQTALEKSVSGTPVRWENPTTGASGSVTPVRTWKKANGTFCRSYREKIRLASGEVLSNKATACRTANAFWKTT